MLSSVTPQLSRHPLSGPAVTSYCTLDILPRKRPDLPVSSLLELLWAEASGFITFKLNDSQMIHLGEGIILLGVLAMLLPLGKTVALAGLILIGLGCAPIYPSIIHSTPAHFGADKSQAIIGVQMAFAYIGTCLMPPLFGIIARSISITLFPAYLGLFLCIMFFMYETVIRKTHTI